MGINKLLQQIGYSIENNEYIWTDPEKYAIIGDFNYTAAWDEVCITVNAFYNKLGGVVILGILDDESSSRYLLKGFGEGNEELLNLLAGSYTNAAGDTINISHCLTFELMPFREGQVLAIGIATKGTATEYACYKNIAYERMVSGNGRIPVTRLPGKNITNISPEQEAFHSLLLSREPEPEPIFLAGETDIPAEDMPVQQIYSGELITLFGADYISLEPDYKQLLSFIYEKHHAVPGKCATTTEIIEKIEAIKGVNSTDALLEAHQKKVKQIIVMMEKNGFISRCGTGQEYRVNTEFKLVKNLFN